MPGPHMSQFVLLCGWQRCVAPTG